MNWPVPEVETALAIFPEPTIVLCDLDGTLVDSVPDLAYSIDEMQAALGLERRGEERVRQWVGNGAERLVHRALTGEMDADADGRLFQQAFPLFLDFYARHTSDRSELYAGVGAGLEQLAALNIRLACITNKPRRFAEPLLKELGVLDFFEAVVGGDCLPQKKPSPEPLLHAITLLDGEPAHTLYVGDSETDVRAARAAGITVVCVTYGYNHGRDIRAAKPDAVIDSLTQLTELFAQAG